MEKENSEFLEQYGFSFDSLLCFELYQNMGFLRFQKKK